MTDYSSWPDANMQLHYDNLSNRIRALIDQKMEIVQEQAKRRMTARRFPRVLDSFDQLQRETQADRDEYAEEMSLGGRNYNPERQ